MEKLGRYIDDDGRMFIPLNRWAKIDVVDGKLEYTPTTCDILHVSEERIMELPVDVFEGYINSGKLKRLK